MGASETELTATVAEIVHIDDKTSRTIDVYLEHDLFQGLIESTNTKFRLLTRIAFGTTASTPTPNALPRLVPGSRLTTTPGPELTHRYSRRAT